jgi:hypothetical protein
MSDLERAIHNERVKYGAAALDRLSTGFILVGCLAPAINLALLAFDQEGVSVERARGVAVLFAVFVLAGSTLHWLGKRSLGNMK